MKGVDMIMRICNLYDAYQYIQITLEKLNITRMIPKVNSKLAVKWSDSTYDKSSRGKRQLCHSIRFHAGTIDVYT